MSALDALADKAQAASERFAGRGGLKGKLAGELADDAAFLRKLKPALIKRRLHGDRPTGPGSAPAAPSGPQLGERPPAGPRSPRGGPNPFVVVGAALVLGVAVAKLIDWRGYAYPRW
jgi:hypothetical protein